MPQQAIVSADRAVGASEWIKGQRENMLSLLADIVNIDSGSFDKPGVARVFRRLEAFFLSRGCRSARISSMAWRRRSR